MNRIHCVNLDNGLRINTDGSCKSCCMMSTRFRDTEGKDVNVKSNSFEEIANSKTRMDGSRRPCADYW